ncbi:uncharacterized protein LOC116344293 [Contarinia nasturtii]|uniref:uncharacterized protein LOC116344293 n=1 Tax=Contarinia nasturtii TaxID=265458 RepID=UPI0012D3A4BE|nr:uncharacterized protein LOC116344293 [Contarinia nasturtii]
MVKRVESPKTKRKGVRVKSIKKLPLVTSNLLMADVNNDCLMSVFDYLDIISLMSVCKTGERYKNLITDHVIPLKTIRFGELSPTISIQKVFKLFGKSMTRIEFAANDIQWVRPGCSPLAEFLHLIKEYCTPGKLQQLSLAGFHNCIMFVEPALLDAVRPFFTELQTFQISQSTWPHGPQYFDDFMKWIPKQNLRELNLHCMHIVGDWLSKENFPNLQNLHICMFQTNWFTAHPWFTESINHLKTYLASKPIALTNFEYLGHNRETVMVELSRYVPMVQRIGVVENTMVDNNNNNWNTVGIREKWKHLNAFTNLKEFRLKSSAPNFNNCGEIFRILAKSNTIKHLELSTGGPKQSIIDPIDVTQLRQLKNVNSLRLVDYDEANSQLMDQMAEHLTGLKECTFDVGPKKNKIRSSSMKQAPIVSLTKKARNLRCLNIDCKVTSFSAAFYKRLVKIRKEINPDEPLTICIDGGIVEKCFEDLSMRTYKPAIITLKSKAKTDQSP